MYCEMKNGQRIHQISAQPFKKEGKTEGVYRLVFSDGKYKEYSVRELKEIDFFKGMIGRFAESVSQTAVLKNVRSDVFEVVLGLTLRGQHISELIQGNDELNYHPELYEILKDALDYFNPGKNEELLRDLKEHQLRHITYEEAGRILANYVRVEGKKDPVWVEVAKTIKLSRIYFKNERDIQAWTEKKKFYDKEFWALNQKIEFHKKKFHDANLSQLEQSLEVARIQSLSLYNLKLHALAAEESLPMICHQRASECSSDDPAIRKMAQQSKEIVDEYKRILLQALSDSGANVDREDLLEHIVGPKNFLFDEYRLKIGDGPGAAQYPFGHPLVLNGKKCLGYSLDNLSPYDLENEIRSDLGKYISNDLPPRIIQSAEITRPLTPEVQNLRQFFMEKLVHWHSLEDDAKRQVIQKLIELSGWNEINIRAEDVVIHEIEVCPNHEVKGSMSVKNHRFNFFFNTYDFVVCFVSEEGVRTNHFGALQLLRMINPPPEIEVVYQFMLRNGILDVPRD